MRLSDDSNTRPHPSSVGYSVRFHTAQLFRDVHPTVTLDRLGLCEQLVKHLNNYTDDVPSMYNDLVRLVGPLDDKNSPAKLRLANFDRVYLESQFENGNESIIFEKAMAYRLRGVTAGSVKNAFPYFHPHDFIWDIRDMGDDKDAYRVLWQPKTHRDRDDFSRVVTINQAFSLNSDA